MPSNKRLRRDGKVQRMFANDLYDNSVVTFRSPSGSSCWDATNCYFYSSAHPCQPHKISKHIMFQTPILRSILRSTEGTAAAAHDGLHVFFPDIPDHHMRSIVTFLHTGVLEGPQNSRPDLYNLIINVFGFDAKKIKVNGYTTADKQLRTIFLVSFLRKGQT